MKILITSFWYTPAINGVVTSIQNLRRELIKKGHEVRILTVSNTTYSFKKDNVYYIGSLPLKRLYPHARLPIKSQNRFYREIIEWEPDVVHSQCEFFTHSISVKIAKTLDIPLVHTYHTIYEDYTHYFSPSHIVGKNVVALFTGNVLAKADRVIAPTNKVRDILNEYNVRPEISTVPTGIDIDSLDCRGSEDTVASLKNNLGLKDHHKVLIALGRIAKEKNLDVIIEYFSHIKDSDIRLVIIGDGPYRTAIEEKVKYRNLNDKVIFTGMVSPRDVGKYYRLGDAFVCGSNSETQGLTYLESLACGLPVICKEDDCIKEVIYNDENGYIFNDRKSFIESVDSVFRDKENYNRLSENAKKSSMKFNKTAFADSIIDVYENAIEEKMRKSVSYTTIS